MFLIHSDSIYVADAKWAVYKEFQLHIDLDNICLQHTCDDYEDVTKVCAVHVISSFSEKVKSIKEAIPVDHISSVVHEAAREALTKENIRDICRKTEIKSEGETIGKVGSRSYTSHFSPTVNRLKKVLVKETLKGVGQDLSSEICKGILKHIQSKVQQNLQQSIEDLKISISEEDLKGVVVAIGTIIVTFFMPLFGIIIAAFTLIYTLFSAVDINSRSWRNKVADEIYQIVCNQRGELLKKVIGHIKEICQEAIGDLEKAHKILEDQKSEIKPIFQQERKYCNFVQNRQNT